MAKTVSARTPALDRGGLSDEQLVAMLRIMLLQRQLDNRGFQLNRQGKIPFALGSEGHEGLQAGAALSGLSCASMVHQNVPHHFRGDIQKVRAALPRELRLP